MQLFFMGLAEELTLRWVEGDTIMVLRSRPAIVLPCRCGFGDRSDGPF